MEKFTEQFKNYACEGDTISVESCGFDVTARIVRDEDAHINEYEWPDDSIKAQASWWNDEWFYCGIVLSVSYRGLMLDEHAASLWGIECNFDPAVGNDYLRVVANELLPEAITRGREQLDKACTYFQKFGC